MKPKFARTTSLAVEQVLTKDSFEVVRKLGGGSFAVVSLVKKKDNGRLFALKEIFKESTLRYDKLKAVFRERDILNMMSGHPNFVRFECTF